MNETNTLEDNGNICQNYNGKNYDGTNNLRNIRQNVEVCINVIKL